MVWRKLLFFTVLMFALPIGTFFAVKSYIGPGMHTVTLLAFRTHLIVMH